MHFSRVLKVSKRAAMLLDSHYMITLANRIHNNDIIMILYRYIYLKKSEKKTQLKTSVGGGESVECVTIALHFGRLFIFLHLFE